MARSPPVADHGEAGSYKVRKGESLNMTVQNQNVKNVYRGNGSTTLFPFTFAINESHPEYIHVYITNDGGKAVETTDFTCDMQARKITYPKTSSSAPKLSSTQRLTIYRLLPYEQNLNLVNQGPFVSEDVERTFDDQEMQIQHLNENLVRCFQIGIEAQDFDMTMELEPDKVICVNSAGNGFEAREALMEVGGTWDGEGRQIKNIADPTSAQDALTRHYYDKGIDNMLTIAGIVTDSGELQHIVDQFNAIDENAEAAATSEANALSYKNAADESATNAAGSANIATAIKNAIDAIYGYPFTAATVSAMTDTSKIYVYTGSESGYTAGNWYYYNGSAWVSGGTFNSTSATTLAEMSLFGIDDLLWDNTSPSSRTSNGVTFTVDKVNKTVAISTGGSASTGSALISFYLNSAAIPSWLTVGKQYYLHCHTDSDAFLRIGRKINNSEDWSYNSAYKTQDVVPFTIGSNVTGLSIQLCVESGKTVNTVVRPFISEELAPFEIISKFDDETKKTKSEMSLFGVDDLLWDNENLSDTTSGNVTYTVDKTNKTVTVSGTSNDYSALVIRSGVSDAFPSWLEKGKKYYAHIHAEKDIYFQITEFVGNNSKRICDTKTVAPFVVSNDATGVNIRLYIKGADVVTDTVVRPFISETLSLSELKDELDSFLNNDIVYKWDEHGVKEINLVFTKSMSYRYDDGYVSNSTYTATNPIPLPKDGVYVYLDDKYVHNCFFVKDENGVFVPDTDYPYCYYGTSVENNVSYNASYYPYKEGTYIIIKVEKAGVDSIHAITGHIEDNGGRLPNLQPNTLFGIYGDGTKETQKLVVLNHFTFGGWVRPSSNDEYINAMESYGRFTCSVVRLRDANKIIAAPPYALVARIFKIDNDNKTAEKYEDIFARIMYAPEVNNEPSATAWSRYICGVPVIDLSKYDFEGYAVIGIVPKITKTEGSTYTWFYMDFVGMLNKFPDIYNHVYVEWKSGVSVTYDGSMNSITKNNIDTVVHNTFAPNLLTPASDGGYGCWITKKGNNPFKILAMGKCSGWWYNATTRFNNPFIHVTPKSFITASKNRHSRVYVPYIHTPSTYTDSGGITHEYYPLINLYGSTCTFGPTISGGSPCGLEVFGVANEWYPFMTYREYENIDSLRAGDILAQGDFLSVDDENTTEVSSNYGHVQLITEKVSINGETFCVNAIEGCQPWTRFKTYVNYEAFDGYTTIYRDDNNDIVTSREIDLFWEFSSRTIGGYFNQERLYTKLGRWKPSKCRTFRDAYGTYDTQDYPVTEIMCDRGTDSVYCIGEHIALTVTDGTTEIELRVGESATQIDLTDYPSTTYTDNGVTDVVYDVTGIIVTDGYHEIYVNNVKKESFFVPPTRALDWDITPDVNWNIQAGKDSVTLDFSPNETNDKVDAIIPFYVNENDSTHRQMAYIDIDGDTVNSNGYCEFTIPYKMYSMSSDAYYELRYVYVLRRTPYGTYYRYLTTYVSGNSRLKYRRQRAGYNEV